MANKQLQSIQFPTLPDTYIIPPDLSEDVERLRTDVSVLQDPDFSVVNGLLCVTYDEGE